MTRHILGFLGVLVVTSYPAHAASFLSLKCGDSKGVFSYSVVDQLRGIPPKEGDVLRTHEVVVNGIKYVWKDQQGNGPSNFKFGYKENKMVWASTNGNEKLHAARVEFVDALKNQVLFSGYVACMAAQPTIFPPSPKPH
jgi:hypothetical protein